MVFSNSARLNRMRNFFLVIGGVWLIVMAITLFLEKFEIVAILAALFLIFVIIVSVLNLQYIRVMVENNKVIVRYYSAFSVDRIFQSIEFPIESLRKIEVHKHLLGLKWDVRFIVQLKKGIAQYPSVSFSAISFNDRSRIIQELNKMIKK